MTAAERVGTFEHDSPEWHAARAQGIGASEIAAIVGLSPYESHFSLWHRKAGIVGPQPVNDLMTWGHYLEPAIAQRFADENPRLHLRRTGTWRSRMRPWQIANPDRLLHGWHDHVWLTKVPVEVKWSPYADGWGPDGSDEIPVNYRCQLLWQMDVMGASFGYLVAMVGSTYREYRIERDDNDIEILRQAGQEFMDSLERGEAPDIDATGHTYQVLRELHPDIEDREVEVSRTAAAMYRLTLDIHRTYEKRAQREKNRMLDAMGTAKYAIYDGQRIARRQPGARGTVALHPIHPPKTPKTIKEAITT